MTERTGSTPVLVLDDVLSELDHGRARALLGHLPAGQVVITTASELPSSAGADWTLRIKAGDVIGTVDLKVRRNSRVGSTARRSRYGGIRARPCSDHQVTRLDHEVVEGHRSDSDRWKCSGSGMSSREPDRGARPPDQTRSRHAARRSRHVDVATQVKFLADTIIERLFDEARVEIDHVEVPRCLQASFLTASSVHRYSVHHFGQTHEQPCEVHYVVGCDPKPRALELNRREDTKMTNTGGTPAGWYHSREMPRVRIAIGMDRSGSANHRRSSNRAHLCPGSTPTPPCSTTRLLRRVRRPVTGRRVRHLRGSNTPGTQSPPSYAAPQPGFGAGQPSYGAPGAPQFGSRQPLLRATCRSVSRPARPGRSASGGSEWLLGSSTG